MKKWFAGVLAVCLMAALALPVSAALPAGAGMVTGSSLVSGSEFSSKASIAAKLDKMFAGDIGLYKDKNKTKLVNAALGTRNVPNNGVLQYWGPEPRAGTSCFAYANAFYCTFYDGVYPHHEINSNHQKVKATGKITYENFVKWGVRDDAAVYIREGNHSVIVLHYDKDYITYVDGNGDGKGLIAIRKEAWTRGTGSNIYNQKPSLIVQPTTKYFPAGSMGKASPVPCTQGGSHHDWDKGAVTKAATCKETGLKVYTCGACGKTREETVAKTGHTYGEYRVTKEPTCGKSGKKTAVCKTCGKEKTKTVKALTHTYGEDVLTREATIFSAGILTKTCSRCNDVQETKTDCRFYDDRFGITLTTQEGVFPENTEVLITTTEENTSEHRSLQLSLQDVSGKFFSYLLDVTAQPKGNVTVNITVPAGFGENLALYTVTDNGAQPLQIAVENGIITTQLEELKILVLCDLDVPWVPESTETVTQPTEEATTGTTVLATAERMGTQQKNDSRILLICVVSALVFGLGVMITVVIVRKRKQAMPEELPEEVYL